MNIILDCDDVLREFVPEVVKTYNKEHFTDYKLEDIITWEIKDVLTEIKDFQKYVTDRKEIFLNSQVCEDVYETINTLKNKGHRIIISTYQFKGIEQYTMEWLKKNNIYYDDIFFGRDKFLVQGDIFVDDKYSNITKYEKFNINTVLFLKNRPWNTGLINPCMNRINTIKEILNYVK